MHRKAAYLISNTANEFAKVVDAVADLRRAQRKELGEILDCALSSSARVSRFLSVDFWAGPRSTSKED
jgi:hypothetical protein